MLILTKNEEVNLPRCLASVSWSDDVLVVDSFSSDGTASIAELARARILRREFDNFANQRNFGLSQGILKHEWVLHLDADEEVTAELRQELVSLATAEGKSAYRIASKLMFQGRWLRYSGMYPSYQVRFGKKSALRFYELGHGQRESLPSAEIGTVQSPLIHHNFSKGVADWMERHNRYSTAEALHECHGKHLHMDWSSFISKDAVQRRRALKDLSRRLPCRPTLRFLYMYICRLGFLDGNPGYTYCKLLSIYEYLITLKVKEYRRCQKNVQ